MGLCSATNAGAGGNILRWGPSFFIVFILVMIMLNILRWVPTSSISSHHSFDLCDDGHDLIEVSTSYCPFHFCDVMFVCQYGRADNASEVAERHIVYVNKNVDNTIFQTCIEPSLGWWPGYDDMIWYDMTSRTQNQNVDNTTSQVHRALNIMSGRSTSTSGEHLAAGRPSSSSSSPSASSCPSTFPWS